MVCVIGDGAMSAGMAYEAMNNAGHMKERLFVVLNDNEMSIAPPVGAMSKYLSRLYAGEPFQDLKAAAKGAVKLLPQPFQEGARRARELVKGMTVGGTLFEELGFSYVGPIDGHDMEQLVSVLRAVKARGDGPVLIHALTRKGKGYAAGGGVERQVSRRREVRRGDGRAGEEAFECAVLHQGLRAILIREAERDERIVAVTAAMPDGTGLNLFAERFPRRCFDVGHRRAACGDLLRRHGGGGDEAVRRDLLDLPAARLRPGGARRGDPAAAGALRHRPGRAGRGGRADPCRGVRRRPISPACRTSW